MTSSFPQRAIKLLPLQKMRQFVYGATLLMGTHIPWKPIMQLSDQSTTRRMGSCYWQPLTTKPWRFFEQRRRSSSSHWWVIRTGLEWECLLQTRGSLLLEETIRLFLCGIPKQKTLWLSTTTISASSMIRNSILMELAWRLVLKIRRLRYSTWEPKDRFNITMLTEMSLIR